MCGIVGQIGPRACGERQLLRMMGMLTHRGPDESGVLIADNVSFGHLRLSIVDLQSGQQPMSTHDGRYWVVFNGEIFNHLELRQELEHLGHTFTTRSDTEVLLNSYREWGISCLDRFNGQWAFALWDSQTDAFFLARDRWGVRPLFYTFLPDGKTLLFASEMKALLADDRVPREWNHQALRDILICWISESDRTPVKSIQQLPPGAYISIKEGRFEIRRWWQLDYSPDYIEWNRSKESWCEELRATLAAACKIRLRADVPVGAYISGGLDSSIIAFLARQQVQNQLRTFSICFEDALFDESTFQRLVAQRLGTDHREARIDHQSIAGGFQKTIWHTETPIYRTAPVPMMHLSNLVRDSRVKVVLTGEGADELFAGYDQFKEDKIRRFWAGNPTSSWRKRLLAHLEPNIPRTGPRVRSFWYAFYQQGLHKTESPGYSHHIRWHNGMSLLPLLNLSLTGGIKDWLEEIESTVPEDFNGWLPLSKAQYWETRQLLSGYLLSSQGDRVMMANSVEGRYPFLDPRLYEFARRIPPQLKLRVLAEKYLLRNAFAEDLPEKVLSRRKSPYRSPEASSLLCEGEYDRLMESFTPVGIKRRGLFTPEAIAKLQHRVRNSPEQSARDNAALVLAYSSHVFHDLFVEGRMEPCAVPSLKVHVDLTSTGKDGNKILCHKS